MIEPIPIALFAALVLALAWRAVRVRSLLVLSALWLVYAVYEYFMYARVLCSGECNIRVDLLLIYPGLLLSTLWFGCAAAFRAIKRRRGAASGD